MNDRLLALLSVFDIATGGRAELPPGAVLRLGDDRLARRYFHVSHIAFTPDGRHIVTGGSGAGIDVWDATTGRPVRRLPGPAGLGPLAVSPNGHWAAASSPSGIILWNLQSGESHAAPPPPPTEPV